MTISDDGSFVHHEVLRRYWYPVARDVDLGRSPLRRTLLGHHLVLFRGADGRPAALPDRCPHRNAPLSAGQLADGCVVCPYHGWTFDGAGRCVEIPSSGPDARIPPKAHLEPHHCVIRYGLVWVCLDEPAAGIPECPWEDDPAYRRLNTPVELWRASTTRMVDNFMDISHFPWVHLGSFGAAAQREVPPIDLGPLPDGFFGYSYGVTAANDVDGGSDASGQAGAVVSREMSSGFALPFCVRSTIHYATGLDHVLYLLSTPVDDVTSYFTFVVWRNDDFAVQDDHVLALDYAIGAEDKAMLEQVSGPLPLGNDGVVSVQSDKPSVEWKRRLRQLLETDPATLPAVASRPDTP